MLTEDRKRRLKRVIMVGLGIVCIIAILENASASEYKHGDINRMSAQELEHYQLEITRRLVENSKQQEILFGQLTAEINKLKEMLKDE